MTPSLEQLPPPPSGRSGWPWTVGPGEQVPAASASSPRITLVTPSYNQGAFIEETIRSVLLQGYPNLEYIVIDGGSTDETVAIIKKYAPWITHWVSERDHGQSHAINKGLSRATGEWFNWINSDDVLAPGALRSLVNAARDPATVVVSGVTANLRDDTVFSRYAAQVSVTWPDTLFSLRVNQPGSLLRLSAVRAVGGIREDLRLTMDLALWLRLALNHGPAAFAYTDAEVATYRYHSASKTCAGEDVFALEEFALLTDLASSAFGVTLPAGLKTLRSHCPALTRPGNGLAAETTSAERAWLDRLVVSDSLLFRALRNTLKPAHDPFPAFLGLLDELAPALGRHHPAPVARRIRARALIHALQISGRFRSMVAWRTLRLSPGWSTLRPLLRLALSR